MSAGSISLESSIRTCKVVTGWADKVQSARFQDPNSQICLMWNGQNSKGQRVNPDSFMTKSAGCNSALDRVAVENSVVRPQYMEYITLNAGGINLGYPNLPQEQVTRSSNDLKNELTHTGQFGYGGGFSQTYPGCAGFGSKGKSSYEETYPTREAYAQANTQSRNQQAINNGYQAQQNRCNSGF
uniref:Uncharacterized protein n=1 Tax=viral metagenome TaxID=1070528 RepID=A0A6C0LY38_9ZZZZ